MNDKVFHDCMNKNNDGTSRVIEKNFTCLCPTNAPFWKRARDVDFLCPYSFSRGQTRRC